jgi:hypothetical protein
LRVVCRLEPSHQSFPDSGGLVRILGPIVLIFLLAMLDTRQQFGFRRTVTSQPICDHYAWSI